jgi:hypothetical protein
LGELLKEVSYIEVERFRRPPVRSIESANIFDSGLEVFMSHILLDFCRVHTGQVKNPGVGATQAMRGEGDRVASNCDSIGAYDVLNRPGR